MRRSLWRRRAADHRRGRCLLRRREKGDLVGGRLVPNRDPSEPFIVNFCRSAAQREEGAEGNMFGFACLQKANVSALGDVKVVLYGDNACDLAGHLQMVSVDVAETQVADPPFLA
jgi:hypothetical protein